MNLNGKRALSVDADTSSDEDDDQPDYYKWNCNQIRAKINQLIRSGEMKVTEFQRSNGINSNSYGRFMKLKGADSGIDNNTYHGGHAFFLRRERKGIKPKAKKAKAADNADYDVSEIYIDGEEGEDLPIYDTCDDIRTKIQAHLRLGVTQAALCREIGKMYRPTRPLQSKQLSDFLRKKGPTCGNTSVVYYGAYVYFEKLRIKNGAERTKKRREVERAKPHGMTRDPTWHGYWSFADEILVEDQFGDLKRQR